MNTIESTQYDAEVTDEFNNLICDMTTEGKAHIIFREYVVELQFLMVIRQVFICQSDALRGIFLVNRINDFLKKDLVSEEYSEELHKRYLDPDVIYKGKNDLISQMNGNPVNETEPV